MIADPTVFVTAMTGQPGAPRQPRGSDRVGGLAGLGDRDDERALVERRRRVAELGADVPARGDARPGLERVGPDRGRVGGAAAGHELDAVDRSDAVGEPVELAHPDRVAMQTPGRGGPDGLGLLVHLLGHEVRVAALLGGLDRPVDLVHRAVLLDARDVGHPDGAAHEVGDVALLEVHDPPRVGQDRGHVRGQERLAVADAHDERDVHPRSDEPLGLAAMEDHERVGADRAAQGLPHGLRPRRP